MIDRTHLQTFIRNLKAETEVLADFKRTVAKSEQEGYLQSLFFTLNKILFQEMKSVLKGESIRSAKHGVDQQGGRHEAPRGGRPEFVQG